MSWYALHLLSASGRLEVVLPVLVVGIALLARRMTIVRRDAVAPARGVSLEAARGLVASVKRRAVIGGLAVAAVIVAGASTGVPAAWLFSLLFAFAVQSYMTAWRADHLLAMPRASAELRGTTLSIGADGAGASVLVTRRGAAEALDASVPRAVVV